MTSPRRQNQHSNSSRNLQSRRKNDVCDRISSFVWSEPISNEGNNRVKQLKVLEGNCGLVLGELNRDKKVLKKGGSLTARQFRQCGRSVTRAIRVSSASVLPQSLLDFKRKRALSRVPSTTRSQSPIQSLPSIRQEVISDYHRAAFSKALRNGLSLKMRYIATMGTTKATDLGSIRAKRSNGG